MTEPTTVASLYIGTTTQQRLTRLVFHNGNGPGRRGTQRSWAPGRRRLRGQILIVAVQLPGAAGQASPVHHELAGVPAHGEILCTAQLQQLLQPVLQLAEV